MGLQIEKEGLLRSVREKDAELSSLWQQAQLQRSSLEQDNDRTSREMDSLRQQLQQRVWAVCVCEAVVRAYVSLCTHTSMRV